MTPKDRLELTVAVVDEIGDLIRDQIREDVAAAMQQYRETYIKSDRWCCLNMTKYMTSMFGASRPTSPDNEHLGMMYTYQNMAINYCPFCGVKL